MSVAELKSEVEKLSPEERNQFSAFLVALRIREDKEFREELTRKIDDHQPENWISLEDLKLRYHEQ